MHPDVKEILYSLEEIEEKSKQLALQISQDYRGKTPILVGLLKGSVPFITTLSKHLTIDVKFDYISVSSYVKDKSSELIVKKGMDKDPLNQDVIIVEDIIDTGKTLACVKEMLLQQGAKSVKIVTLLDKKAARKTMIEADYVGFEMPNAFAVGFGLDYDEKYRQLPYIGILKKECIK